MAKKEIEPTTGIKVEEERPTGIVFHNIPNKPSESSLPGSISEDRITSPSESIPEDRITSPSGSILEKPMTRREFIKGALKLGKITTVMLLFGGALEFLTGCAKKPQPNGQTDSQTDGPTDEQEHSHSNPNQERFRLLEEINNFIWEHLPGKLDYIIEIKDTQPTFHYYVDPYALESDEQGKLTQLLKDYRSFFNVPEGTSDDELLSTLIEQAIYTSIDNIPLVSEESSEALRLQIDTTPPISLTISTSIINLFPGALDVIQSMLKMSFSPLDANATSDEPFPIKPINIQIQISDLATNMELPEEDRRNARQIDAVTMVTGINHIKEKGITYETIINNFSAAPLRAKLVGLEIVLTEIVANEITNMAPLYYILLSTEAFNLYVDQLREILDSLTMRQEEKDALLELLEATRQETIKLYTQTGNIISVVDPLERLSTIGAIILTNAIAEEKDWRLIRYSN